MSRPHHSYRKDVDKEIVRKLVLGDEDRVWCLVSNLPRESEKWSQRIDRNWVHREIQVGLGYGLFLEKHLLAFVFYRDQVGEHEITLLMVDQDRLREGVMSRLFEYYLSEIVKEKPVFLEVYEGNQVAISFYRKFGFEVTGRRPRYYGGQGAAICMSRR